MPNPMTRRIFGSLLASASAALSSTGDFVSHRVLRRPYRVEDTFPAKPYMLYDALRLRAGKVSASLRIKVTIDGQEESVLEATVSPRPGEGFIILGVHGFRAENTGRIVIESERPFDMDYLLALFMHPAFKRVDGMAVYHDPFYKPRPDDGVGINAPIHHRKFFGPGKDIGYL